MIHISDVDKQKWDNGNSYKSITIVFPNISLALDNDDIYGESMTLSEGLFDGNGELCIYGCISSIFTVEVRYKPALANVDFKGQYVAVSMTASESSSINLFHGFVYGVETVREKKYIKLTCYDRIGIYQDMDVYSAYHSAFVNSPIVTVKGMRDTICSYLGITQEVQTLANDMLVITEDEGLTELAAINILRAICQINGVFGIINRDGKMEYRKIAYWYEQEPYPSNELFPNDDLFPGEISGDNHEYIDVYKSLGYQDYNVEEIDRVVVRDSSNDPESGAAASALPFTNALLIEGNMLVTGKDSTEKADIAHNILDNVDYITYRPFEATNRGYPYIEVGDSVSYYSALDHALFTFSVLKRELKGVQWLEDRYSASGEQYQPEVKYEQSSASNPTGGSDISSAINDIKTDIKEIDESKQDNLTAGTGIDIISNVISVTNPIILSTVDLIPGVSELPSGTIYFVYE